MADIVEFPNGGRASVVQAAGRDTARHLLDVLEVPRPDALIVVVGGADSLDSDVTSWLTQLFSRGLVAAARSSGAMLVDGGTDSGVMAILGRAVAARASPLRLLGVAPRPQVSLPGEPREPGARVPLEPHHSHFVLVQVPQWGDETDMLFRLADELADDVPVAAVLVGGGRVAQAEALHIVRRGWPLFVVTPTGGLADRLARLVTERRERKPGSGAAAEDAALAEVVADGDITLVPLESDPAAFRSLLLRRLRPDPSLELAWEQFAFLDANAIRQQKEFRQIQAIILALGVAGTLLAVTQATIESEEVLTDHWARDALRYVLILVPIGLAGLMAAAARFRAGSKWVVLRGSAEAVKREIFQYRARTGVYGDADPSGTPRQVRLAERLGTISGGAMKTDVNLAGLRPYRGPVPPAGAVAEDDDGLSPLTPEQYLRLRLRHQATWYQDKIVKLERRLRGLRAAVIVFGGLGTFLAAIGFELWIAVTTAIVGAFTTYLEYMQVESTLLHYNLAAADLETMRRWWISLPADRKADQENVNRLVEQAERIMQSESAGWLQEMQDAMAELRRQQEESEGAKGAHHPG